jgi:hypothetical protein
MNETLITKIRQNNIALLKSKGYVNIDWFSPLELPALKSVTTIKSRLLILNVFIDLSFDAPVNNIKTWVKKNNLMSMLTSFEKNILSKSNLQITQQELAVLRWNLESIWALMWTIGMIDDLDETLCCQSEMCTLLPTIEENDGIEKLNTRTSMRSEYEITKMLDYYHRILWYCLDSRISNSRILINEDIVYERLKALYWVVNRGVVWTNSRLALADNT